MRSLRAWGLRFTGFFGKERKDRELAEELESHLQMQIEDNLRAGMSPQEARRNALITFGGMESTKERFRRQRGLPFLEALLKNLGFGVRLLRKSPGFTAVVVLTLALGIGANTAIFTVAYATLLAPLPYPQPDRLVNVWSKLQGHRNWVSAGDFTDWKRQSTAFEDLNAWGPGDFNIATQDRPEDIEGMEATPGYYGMLGNPLFLGRNFLPEEGEPGKEHVVILTYRLWRHLGANPKIIGQTMQINGEPYTVVGVLAPGTADRWDWELIVPLVFKPEQLSDHDSRDWLVTGRLKPGVTIQQAQAEMDAITAKEAKDYPKSNQGWGALVEPFKNDFLPSDRQLTLWLLLGAVGFLLLIACLNVANLLLAKGITRQREVAIRGSLGAKPAAIFAQFLTESLVLAILGGVLGRRCGVRHAAGVGCGDAPACSTRGGGSATECSRPALHAGRHDAGWRALWLCPRVVRLTPRSGGSAQGGRALGNRRGPPPASPGSRDRRVCLGPAAACRSGVGDSQLLESDAHRSRRPHRSHSWLLRRFRCGCRRVPTQINSILSPYSCQHRSGSRRLPCMRDELFASR